MTAGHKPRRRPLPPAATSAGRLSPISQCIDQDCESRRSLPSARIVQVITREGRAPIGQHPGQPALGYIWLHVTFRQISKTEAIECGAQERPRPVEDQLTIHPDVENAAILFELPGVEAAMGWQSKVQAIMIREVLR